MTTEIVPITTQTSPDLPRQQATNDEALVQLWLHGRRPQTRRAYEADAQCFRRFVGKPLHEVTLEDLQGFADSLVDRLQPASRHRRLSAIKSLFAFGCRIGYLQFDVGRVMKLPSIRDRLAERILSETEVQRMLALELHPRNQALLYFLYATGVRVSEACAVKWRELQAREESGQVTVLGKGGKTNTILLPPSVWNCVMSIRDGSGPDAPVFPSRKGRHLHPTQVRRIVRQAAKRAGIEKAISPHWLRHGHASHALDRGAPIHLVQATLGHASVATTGRYLHARPTDSSSNYLSL